jgi:hypothetical protein
MTIVRHDQSIQTPLRQAHVLGSAPAPLARKELSIDSNTFCRYSNIYGLVICSPLDTPQGLERGYFF